MRSMFFKTEKIIPVYVPKTKKKHREGTEKMAYEFLERKGYDISKLVKTKDGYPLIFNYILCNQLRYGEKQIYVPDKFRSELRNQLLDMYNEEESIDIINAYKHMNPWIEEYISMFLFGKQQKETTWDKSLDNLPEDEKYEIYQNLIEYGNLDEKYEISSKEITRFLYYTFILEMMMIPSDVDMQGIDFETIEKKLCSVLSDLDIQIKELLDIPVNNRDDINKTKDNMVQIISDIHKKLEDDSVVQKLFVTNKHEISNVINFCYRTKDFTEPRFRYLSSIFQLSTVSRCVLWKNIDNIKNMLFFMKYLSDLDDKEYNKIMDEDVNEFMFRCIKTIADLLSTQILFSENVMSFKLKKIPYKLLDCVKLAYDISKKTRDCFHVLNNKFNNIVKEETKESD